ncbi:hypothetical protein [Vibrio sp. CAU 1672]|uniref:hypothetical protein n=1 Tax=Vibrio sp. CAU 1672 TaxID=3032594 RepID=UPI0023DC2738|nr:hypothetical protein [Vibrio sp. CAU 1672]MDF2155117.1 hypothetical protein [Vibrio sp. CAU 1672]
MSKLISLSMVAVLGLFTAYSSDVAAEAKHKPGHKHHHKHYHKPGKVVVVKHKSPKHKPKHRYYHYKRVPSNATYIKIGNLTYLKVDGHYYKRSRDQYIHIVL